MSITTSVFIATSVDGYIARPDGSLDWLTGDGSSSDNEDYGYDEFFAGVDCLAMGRATYETVLSFSQWPYHDRDVYVLSRSPEKVQVPADLSDRVTITAGGPQKLLRALEAAGKGHVYVDGGATIQAFLRESAIDMMTITQIPVLLGCGIPLFGELQSDVHLLVEQTKSYPSGYVQTTYRVLGTGAIGPV